MEQYLPDLKGLRMFADAALKAGQAVAECANAYARFGAAFAEMMWDAYRKDGAPYGDTPEGLNRWLRERSFTEQLMA